MIFTYIRLKTFKLDVILLEQFFLGKTTKFILSNIHRYHSRKGERENDNFNFFGNKILIQYGSPGLLLMGRDSCSKGREFPSRHCILDGHFSHLFVVKIVMCVGKDENKWKRGRVKPIFFKKNKGLCHSRVTFQAMIDQGSFFKLTWSR